MLDILSSLILAYSFQVGYGNSEYILWDKFDYSLESRELITTEFNLELKCKYFYVGGGFRTPTIKSTGRGPSPVGYYTPVQCSYNFESGVQFKHVKAGFTHTCQHPITPYTLDSEIRRKVEGSYWQVFIKVSNEFHPFK